MTTLKLFISLFIVSSSYGQNNVTALKNWKSYKVPSNQDSLNIYSSEPNDWIVNISNNEIYAVNWTNEFRKPSLPFELKQTNVEQRIFRGQQTFLKVDDGYLIGFNRGEWGGNLYWFSNDGSEYYKISNDQIVQFKVRNEKIYAIEGLAHLSTSEGSIIEIKKENCKWESIEYLKLPTAPEAMELDSKNNFVIVTSSSLLSVDNNRNVYTLIATGIWDNYLYANSLVIQNEIIYIGMRKGIFKYNLLTKNEEWLLPY